MNDQQRIGFIERARTKDDLCRAVIGYKDQVISEHPALRIHKSFNDYMENGRFFQALSDVRRVSRAEANKYLDVIMVLESAAKKELSFF